MKTPAKKLKKKIAFPRRRWQINPSTRVEEPFMRYSRPKLKANARRLLDE
ncbi:hypothetical protein OAK45_09875 [Verrucomicrobia bacterium]|nr:hypothetical protein [Verrucomicrobiota bacterium]MDC0219852.1 hypothetical protein [Verrucomicrobiota bacterium]